MDQELEEIVSEESSSSKDVENETNLRETTLDEFIQQCGPLLQAAIKGYWPKADAFLKKHPEFVRAPITKEEGTVLHVAVIAQRTSFVKELLKLISPDDLELKNKNGFTALHCAAQSGNVRIAEQLVKIKPELLLIPEYHGDTPLNVAAYLGRHANMVSYLLSQTPLKDLTEGNRIELLAYTTYNELYDIALEILKMDPTIINMEISGTRCGWRVLEMLAKKPFAIGSESQLSFRQSLLNFSTGFKGNYNKALMKALAVQLVERLWTILVGSPHKQFSSNLDHCLALASVFEAAKVGNVEFLIIVGRYNPDILWQGNEENMTIFHIAVQYRQKGVFSLINEMGNNFKGSNIASNCTSNTKENMLHLAGYLAPPDQLNIVSGAALQMQQELLWFKEIEKIVPLSYVSKKNLSGQTPKEIFTETHTYLRKDGEKWMKETSNYCIVVATLIATVVFAAALTAPGGNNQEMGTPIFLRSSWFLVFLISDSIALCFSSTSIMVFLSIFWSRYREVDFLTSLPSKLVVGLATLFISIVGMMVAFGATCFLMYGSARAWPPVVVLTSTSIPITSFFLLHYKIWVDTYRSTYSSRFLLGSDKRRLF